MYPRFLQLFLNNQIENLAAVFNDEYDTHSHTKKVFANTRRQGKDFSGTVTQLFATILIQPQADVEEGGSPRRQDTILGDRPAQTRFEWLSKQSNDPTLSRVNTLGSGEDSIKLQELMDLCIKLSERVLALENIKTAQDLEITNLKKRSSAEKSLGDQEDASKQGRNKINQDKGISWFQKDAETRGRYGHDISTAEVTTASVPFDVDVSVASPIRPVDDLITDDITLAETLMKI
ncbi:hypothetical protein Tco_0744369 [Tanacetum coccineum]